MTTLPEYNEFLDAEVKKKLFAACKEAIPMLEPGDITVTKGPGTKLSGIAHEKIEKSLGMGFIIGENASVLITFPAQKVNAAQLNAVAQALFKAAHVYTHVTDQGIQFNASMEALKNVHLPDLKREMRAAISAARE